MLKNYICVPLLALLAGCSAAKKETAEATPPAKAATGVGCVGRILPEDGSFFVSAYTAGGRSPVIDQIKIKAGDDVVPGQTIATLVARPYLEAAVREAESRVELARHRVERVKAKPLPEESAVINAEISRLQVQRDAAAREYERTKPMVDKDFVPKAQLDALDVHVKEADAAIAQARTRLSAVGIVRPEDVSLAEGEVHVAEAELARTRQELDSSVVRAPSKGHVLRIIAHPGEAVGPQGIAELADTSRMSVIAEVYETDISRVHLGEKAVVTSELLPGPLNGEVAYIGQQIDRQDPLSTEPGAPSDMRIFKVRLHMDDQSVLGTRINGKVNVVMQP